MTRLRTKDIEQIASTLDQYDRRLREVTGHTLRDLARHALGLSNRDCEEMARRFKVSVVPMTCGQGIIPGFCEAVSAIVSHLGFQSHVTRATDATGLAEACETGADCLLFADDQRFVAAVNLPDGSDLWYEKLPACAVKGGAAVDHAGRIFVALDGGRVICLN